MRTGSYVLTRLTDDGDINVRLRWFPDSTRYCFYEGGMTLTLPRVERLKQQLMRQLRSRSRRDL